jgi:riboflavin kinase/FMN adenylyltransferase
MPTMRLFRSYLHLPETARGAVVVLGNFDGLHRGHLAVIGQGAAIARTLGAPLAVLTFEPHPRSVFRPEEPPFRLTPLRIKERQLEAVGIDLLVIVHFDQAFLHRDAGNFVSEVLVGGLGIRHAVAGTAFHFGHHRTGDMALLAQLGQDYGFGVTGVGLMHDEGGAPLSSTRVRQALQSGRPRVGLRPARGWGAPWAFPPPTFPWASTCGRPLGSMRSVPASTPALPPAGTTASPILAGAPPSAVSTNAWKSICSTWTRICTANIFACS